MTTKTLLAGLASCVLVAGCSHAPKAGSGFWSEVPQYVDFAAFTSADFAAPPEDGSAADIADLAAVREAQAKRTPSDCARAAHEVPPDYEHLIGAAGPFALPLKPEVRSFFWRVRSDAARSSSVLKKRFHHKRPYKRAGDLEPCVKREPEDSYPSGHAMIARVFAHILADLVPARRERYFERADAAALDRVVGGVHYPSDIAGGKTLADEFYRRLTASPAYQTDLAKVRRSVATGDVREPAQRLIFDTDSAFFADDGVALAMLLKDPRYAVDGVTLVAGNYAPLQGAVYMTHVAGLLGRPDLPFYLGADHPLRNTVEMAREMKEKWKLGFMGAFGRPAPVPGKLNPPSGGKFSGIEPRRAKAVDYIVRTLASSPEPVTFFAIGPMTNLALALQREPGLAKKIERLVFMGGNVRVPGNTTPDAEFNIWFDPEAAKLVLAAPIREKVMIGLDLTNQALIDRARFDELVSAGTPLSELLKDDLGNHYPKFLTNPKATRYIWDALASAYLVDPAVVTRSEPLYLDVVTEFGPRYGAMTVKDKAAVGEGEAPVTVLTGLDFERFLALLKTTLR
ncbi:MAG: nucleoside hydrolase [Elusimicrobiota bacterium]|jgi:inosine-uridine nucleoside N-ribohydrolase/membrane-associated phospholipid phosphatase